MITIFVPAYNEEKILEDNIIRLREFLEKNIKEHRIVILDSNSKDKTAAISKNLKNKFDNVSYLNINSPGKGGKIKTATLNIKSDFYTFIDADLPIGLEEFRRIIESVSEGDADLAISYREKSNRPLIRKIVSKIGHLVFRIFFGIKVKDVFAGAKAWNRKVAEKVWPKIEDKRWFFDFELVHYCKKMNMKIREIPVTYSDERKGKFNVWSGILYTTTKLIKFVLKDK